MAHESRQPLMKRMLEHESKALGRYELEICQKFDHVVWVTEQDRQAVQNSIRRMGGWRMSVEIRSSQSAWMQAC